MVRKIDIIYYVLVVGITFGITFYLICFVCNKLMIKEMQAILIKINRGDYTARLNSYSNDAFSESFNLINHLIYKLEKTDMHLLIDHLTQIGNRRALIRYFDQDLSLVKEKDIYAIYIDIDNFKGINDTYGHRIGDKVLETIGTILRTQLSDNLRGYRLYGDEFVIVASIDKLENIEMYINKLNNLFNKKISFEENQIMISMSYGVSKYMNNDKVHSLLDRADQEMYKNKKVKK
ncbi:GGDEF domain-containing protein [Macrococcus animalis]